MLLTGDSVHVLYSPPMYSEGLRLYSCSGTGNNSPSLSLTKSTYSLWFLTPLATIKHFFGVMFSMMNCCNMRASIYSTLWSRPKWGMPRVWKPNAVLRSNSVLSANGSYLLKCLCKSWDFLFFERATLAAKTDLGSKAMSTIIWNMSIVSYSRQFPLKYILS